MVGGHKAFTLHAQRHVKVLLVVIDAASPRVVCPAVQTGRLPNLKRLAEAGEMHSSSVSIFPSITPAATASIITGQYPSGHGICGAAWYDQAKDEVAYYGDDLTVIAADGFGTFLENFLTRLNGDRLTAQTLFERIEASGRTAGSLNYLVYRGLTKHKVNVPWLLSILPGVPFTEHVNGPSMLCLGDFVSTRTPRGHIKHDKGGVLHRFGMDDAGTASLLLDLAESRAFPDFTVAYFGDNDYRSHEVGPHAALPVIDRVDAALGAMFEASGGFDAFLRDTCVIVTSDHGHCEILTDRKDSAVHLDEILGDFKQARLGLAWREGEEIMICPNMRATQIYLRHPTAEQATRLAREALTDPRVDQAIWLRALTEGGAPGYAVMTGRGRLDFWRAGADAAGMGKAAGEQARDAFGGTWGWTGDLDALGMERDGRDVDSETYPNAFERIAGALDARNSGDIWVTARPGCEFEVTGGDAHTGGGSHGALHALDSLSPVIVAGLGRRLPRAMRSIDIASLCLEMLGIVASSQLSVVGASK